MPERNKELELKKRIRGQLKSLFLKNEMSGSCWSLLAPLISQGNQAAEFTAISNSAIYKFVLILRVYLSHYQEMNSTILKFFIP